MKFKESIKQIFLGQYMTEFEIVSALQNGSFSIRYFCKGDLLHLQGDDCTVLEILLEGMVASFQINQYGEEIIIHTLEKSDIFSPNTIFGSHPKYLLFFMAQSDGCLLEINKTYFFELLSKRPHLLRYFLMVICDREAQLGKKLKLAERKPLRDLIMEFLISQSNSQNSNIITLPISKTDLAKNFDVQRTSISREFTRIEKDGLIKIYPDKKTIKLLV